LISARPITWTSDNTAVATVDANGLVTGVSAGSANVVATTEHVSGTATVTVTTISFASVTAGDNHSCGLTTSGAAYCWGGNSSGQLGNGSTDPSLVPAPVIGGLTFTALDVGSEDSCGLTTSGAAYCWGNNQIGQLGNGTSGSFSSAPVAVTGGLTFTAVSVGSLHTCGVTTAGSAYCWGRNGNGELGVGTTTGPETCTLTGSSQQCSTAPVQVVAPGGLTFTMVSAGYDHTCAVTSSGAAYCWGFAAPGDGTSHVSSFPVAVSGGLTFMSVTADGWDYTCGLVTSGAAYCWGFGILGDGSDNPSLVPVAVAGGLTFTTVTMGYQHACGVATGGAAYCWGANYLGQLGTGSTDFSRVPVAVSGGLTFTTVTSGSTSSCGITNGGAAYCWGANYAGQLGNGSANTLSTVPVKVAGQP
jgi:alpha-tubulin suppressor-like RCC1 family protein